MTQTAVTILIWRMGKTTFFTLGDSGRKGEIDCKQRDEVSWGKAASWYNLTSFLILQREPFGEPGGQPLSWWRFQTLLESYFLTQSPGAGLCEVNSSRVKNWAIFLLLVVGETFACIWVSAIFETSFLYQILFHLRPTEQFFLYFLNCVLSWKSF